MIIGLTGPNASGKGEAAEYLKRKGYTYFSLSDIIREFATNEGLEHSRENLIAMGNKLREENGFGVLAKQTNKKIEQTKGNCVIDSIRNPHEVDELRKNKEFILLGISAPIEVRFERARIRGRIENATTLDMFKEMEAKENTQDEGAQQLTKTFSLSDGYIENNGSLEEFHKKIDDMLSKVGDGNE